MGSCPLCSARTLDLGLVVRHEVHLAQVDRLSGRVLGASALLLVAFVAIVLVVQNRIESFCEEVNNQVAVSTPPPRRVGVEQRNLGLRGRTRNPRPVGLRSGAARGQGR